MPIYEYACPYCGSVFERLVTTTREIKNAEQAICENCMRMVDKIMSPTKFRVTGFSAANGYNLPNYNDVIDADGYAKKRWGKD